MWIFIILQFFNILPLYHNRPIDGNDNVDVIISHGRNNHQRLFATFSPTGLNYETNGNIVQVSSFRACNVKRIGLDRTVFGHISVIFVDEIQPFLTGCITIENQALVAEKSGALALIVGPSSRIKYNNKPIKMRSSKIPVVILDDEETIRLREELDEARKDGNIASLRLHFVDKKPTQILKLQVFRPTALNLALIGLLFILVLFISVLVFVKIRWRPTVHRDIWLRSLARSALTKMEIRKFQKIPSREKSGRFGRLKCRPSYQPVFGSLTSVANTTTAHDRCVICLDEYNEGSELRVLFCGHEFHPKCVDPWLLSNRRCPLCQYDVVYKQYPKTHSPNKISSSALDSSEPLVSHQIAQNSIQPPIQRAPPGHTQRVLAPPSRPLQMSHRTLAPPGRARRITSSRSLPRRRPLRSRNQLDTAVRIGGYSSDVSSHIDIEPQPIVL